SAVRGLLYDQAPRPGPGIGDQPLDYRRARRPAVGDRECAPRRRLAVHGAAGERGGGMTDAEALVFVVDDDASLRASLQDLLESVGLRVAACASAQEFLRSPRPEVPTCLVLDVRLPGLSGLQLQQRLAPGDTAIPIIFITGHGDIPMSVQAMKAGAVDFLSKPFRDQDLLDAVHQALARDRTARAQRAQGEELRRRYRALTPRERDVLARVVPGLLN